MSRQDVGDSLVDLKDEFAFEQDVQVAARTRVPVLISGSPRAALLLTQSIAGRLSRSDRSIRIVACDIADCGELSAVFGPPAAASPTRPPRPSIVLLREVQGLSEAGQAVLTRLLGARPPDSPRVFSSASVSLHGRVKEGRFDEQLFYYLNAIHIVTADAKPN